MAVPLCAHRCEVVQMLVLREARRGVPERVVRLGLGLTPEYVPPIPPCGHAATTDAGTDRSPRGAP